MLANIYILLVILALAIWLFVLAILRLIHESNDVIDPKIMFVTSFASLIASIFKLIAFEHVCSGNRDYNDPFNSNQEDRDEFDILIEAEDSPFTSTEPSSQSTLDQKVIEVYKCKPNTKSISSKLSFSRMSSIIDHNENGNISFSRSIDMTTTEQSYTQRRGKNRFGSSFVNAVRNTVLSVILVFASLIIFFKGRKDKDFLILDSVCTFLFSLQIVFTTISVFGDNMNILMGC